MYTEEELRRLDLEILTALYRQHVEELNTLLLDGADWQALTELRHYLTQIGVAIDVIKTIGIPAKKIAKT